MQNSLVRDKSKATSLEKYGCECPLQNATVREKSVTTNLEKYGCEYALQNAEVQEKWRATTFEIYGFQYALQNAEIKEKSKATNLEKYGYEHAAQNKDVEEKRKVTNFERLGCEYPMQNAQVFERNKKAQFKRKLYRFPSGKEVDIQGYEPFALDLLLSQSILEEDVILGFDTMPCIMYEHNDTMHRYYPDIFIPSQNKIVEVKSEYTYKVAREVAHLKMQACQDAGLAAEIWIFSPTAVLLRIIDDFSLKELEHLPIMT